jgi:3-methyladenine DNA glycosylase Mpg
MLLPKTYDLHHDVVFSAKDLIGKHLFSKIDGQLCGGIITETEVCEDAVLIRAIHATHGEELMLKRTGKPQMNPQVTNEPEKVTKVLGITFEDNEELLQNKLIWIEDRNLDFQLPDAGICLHPAILGA